MIIKWKWKWISFSTCSLLHSSQRHDVAEGFNNNEGSEMSFQMSCCMCCNKYKLSSDAQHELSSMYALKTSQTEASYKTAGAQESFSPATKCDYICHIIWTDKQSSHKCNILCKGKKGYNSHVHNKVSLHALWTDWMGEHHLGFITSRLRTIYVCVSYEQSIIMSHGLYWASFTGSCYYFIIQCIIMSFCYTHTHDYSYPWLL